MFCFGCRRSFRFGQQLFGLLEHRLDLYFGAGETSLLLQSITQRAQLGHVLFTLTQRHLDCILNTLQSRLPDKQDFFLVALQQVHERFGVERELELLLWGSVCMTNHCNHTLELPLTLRSWRRHWNLRLLFLVYKLFRYGVLLVDCRVRVIRFFGHSRRRQYDVLGLENWLTRGGRYVALETWR